MSVLAQTGQRAAARPTAPVTNRPRRRVLLAPVTVTPSKPLTPSHLKGLLWTDVMYRATAHVADVDYRYSHTTYHCTEQTLGFWEFLDRAAADVDHGALSAEQIGELYVRYRAEPNRVPADALRPYADAVERHGWVHPAAERVLDLWTAQYARLGMHDPGLTTHQPPGLGLEETIDRLCAMNLCLDLRAIGGPVYLDGTRHGLPLRVIVSADGRPNYLACALRELVPLAPEYDELVLLYDDELAADYVLLQRTLGACGPDVRRVALGRVPIDGVVRSARHGGWQGHTAGAVLRTLGPDYEEAAVRIGVRLYFIAMLGPGSQQSFRYDLLRKACARADRWLADGPAADPLPVAELVSRHQGEHCYVDPYRLTTGLLGRHRSAPAGGLLSAVYL
ncbi:hypothetical protein ACFYZB_23310 [Streptomyces sp. NPDC001852]|uniref:hypothetical protein n=1 Tax=Streptomyces sp. NPDC001852 TaxID=3364619 RepID=UPI003698E2B5